MRPFLAIAAIAFVLAAQASGSSPAAAGSDPHRSASSVRLVLPVRYVSQLAERAPAWWRGPGTPYCVAASAAMILSGSEIALPESPLASLFALGHAANRTDDPGIDPAGTLELLDQYGEAAILLARDKAEALAMLRRELEAGNPSIVITKAGAHAAVVFGYEADATGELTSLYVADPLSGVFGPVAIGEWLGSSVWWRERFSAAGPEWQGAYVFVAYRVVTRPLFDDVLIVVP